MDYCNHCDRLLLPCRLHTRDIRQGHPPTAFGETRSGGSRMLNNDPIAIGSSLRHGPNHQTDRHAFHRNYCHTCMFVQRLHFWPVLHLRCSLSMGIRDTLWIQHVGTEFVISWSSHWLSNGIYTVDTHGQIPVPTKTQEISSRTRI